MTDEIASNPFADMSPDVPQETVRDYAAALVKNGMSVDEINRHLSARNAAPLVRDNLDMAAAAKERLINDPSFSARYLAGDTGAVAEMTALDLRIARGGPSLTDRDPAPGDYTFPIGGRFPDAPIADVQKYHDELASFAADLKLPADIAKSLVDSHLNAAAREGRMTEDEREDYLLRYAQEASWREDNRRTSNGEQVHRVAGLAMCRKPSVDFSGYWQRHMQKA